MSLPPLAQSADKQVLFARLGLDERTHKLLLHEAQRARDSLSTNPHDLSEISKRSPHIRPPYKWDELTETARHRETLNLARNAQPETRPYYEKGSYRTNVADENWVARWYLWHSFRYKCAYIDRSNARAEVVARDSNQVNRPRGAQIFVLRESNAIQSNAKDSTPSAKSLSGGTKYWDPARDQ
ncbi:hypothetical protein ACEQ8H_006269 [Pleosporales sp. CAS-2024a]